MSSWKAKVCQSLDVKLDDGILKHYVPSQISQGFALHAEVSQVF